jgi:hypothetical protein
VVAQSGVTSPLRDKRQGTMNRTAGTPAKPSGLASQRGIYSPNKAASQAPVMGAKPVSPLAGVVSPPPSNMPTAQQPAASPVRTATGIDLGPFERAVQANREAYAQSQSAAPPANRIDLGPFERAVQANREAYAQSQSVAPQAMTGAPASVSPIMRQGMAAEAGRQRIAQIPPTTPGPADQAVVDAAQQREAARMLGGASLAQAGAVAAGGTDAQGIIARASEPASVENPGGRSPARDTPIGGYSPLAGDADNFNRLAGNERAKREQSDAENAARFERFRANRDRDDNNNGIPDRDEAVASKYGSVGINNVNELENMSARYNTYMRGYRSDPEARANTRAMTFDEFAKAEQESYKQRPVYGMDQPAGEGGAARQPDGLARARAAGMEAARAQREQRLQALSPVRAMAQDRRLLNETMANALQMGFGRDQAAMMAQQALAEKRFNDEQRAARGDAIGLEQFRENAATGRATIAADAQRYGTDRMLDSSLAGYASQENIARGRNEVERFGIETVAETQAKRDAILTASQERITQINADTTLSAAEKQAETAREEMQARRDIAELTTNAQTQIAAGQDETQRYIADNNLVAQQIAQETQAEIANIQSQTQLGAAEIGARVAEAQERGRQRIAEVQAETAREGMRSQENIARDQNTTQIALSQQQIEGQMRQLEAKIRSPESQVETIAQLYSMNPSAVGEQARGRAMAEFQAANPTATQQMIQRVGEQARATAMQSAIPMWQAISANPVLAPYVGGAVAGGAGVAGSTGGLVSQGIPTSAPATATPGIVSPISGGPTGVIETAPQGYRPPEEASEWEVVQAVSALTNYLGRTPTRQEVEQQLMESTGGLRVMPRTMNFSSPFFGQGSSYMPDYRNYNMFLRSQGIPGSEDIDESGGRIDRRTKSMGTAAGARITAGR